MGSEIVERDNYLYVLDAWQSEDSRPIRYRAAWPTGLIAKDHLHLIGECEHVLDGQVRTPQGVVVTLEDRGQTKISPQYTEERRIPRPAGKHEYRSGAWRV